MKKYGKINIFGTWYDLYNQTENDNPKMVGKDGMCESYAKQLIIDTSVKNDKDAFANVDDYFHFILRHEAFHAIFHEIGHGEDYCRDEVLVNILAHLYPKIRQIMDKLDDTEI